MPSIKESFESVLEDFKKDLTPKEVEKFQFATLEEFEEAALKIQKDQENTKSMKNMGRIKSFLEAMDQFGKVIDVFLNASPFVCFVWGPLKFILQVSQISYGFLGGYVDSGKGGLSGFLVVVMVMDEVSIQVDVLCVPKSFHWWPFRFESLHVSTLKLTNATFIIDSKHVGGLF